MSGEPNLRVLQPSRKRVRVGDVFTLSPALHTYLFGRVMSTTAKWAERGGDVLLIYIYDVVGKSPQPPKREALVPKRLLIEPVMTNRLGWSRGYFMTIDHSEVGAADRLPDCCFGTSQGEYYDENGRLLSGPCKCVFPRVLHSYRTIDDLVSRALRIPEAPD